MELGRLDEIDVRKVWAHEQYDFSKWLSLEENIKYLSVHTDAIFCVRMN